MMAESSFTGGGEAKTQTLSALLLRLSPDLRLAWERYSVIYSKLIKFFEFNQCSPAEDYADQVLDRIAKKPDLDQILDIPSFAIGVARMVRFEYQKQLHRSIPVDEDTETSHPGADRQDNESALIERIDDEVRLGCLRKCLADLRADERDSILQYYSNEDHKNHEHRRALAASLGVSTDTLRVRMNRSREKLERGVRECLAARQKRLRYQSENSGLPID